MKRVAMVVLLGLLSGCGRGMDADRYPLVPVPEHVKAGSGSFVLDDATRVVLEDTTAGLREAAMLVVGPMRLASGLPLPVVVGSGDEADAIVLGVEPWRDSGSDERYRLAVTPTGVKLTAPAVVGVFRGLQTLRQLLPSWLEQGVGREWRTLPPVTGGASSWSIPAVEIEDGPRFAYRGLHLDVARHFFPPSAVKKYIDLMVLYKYNTLHWHLTDDQGWRIEIKRYPKLTQVGAWRSETQVGWDHDPYAGDGQRYGGYYTQDEVRDIVAYAAARHITVIPEIEMPGHARAALASYPSLGCNTPDTLTVATTWGVFPQIYCPKEATFTFLENVLTEVMDLFPSRYIHIGGDEAPKASWRASDSAQAVILGEDLADEEELQSWFVQRIERFLRAHGRQLIGWDEILQGGLAPGATVMSWRGMEGGIEAARQGHDVIMTPGHNVYLDHYQGDPRFEPLAIGGDTPLDTVYAFEPVPAELTPAEARHVIGAQGNVWTEYIPDFRQVEYMAYPRALALAEVLWSPRRARDWPGFLRRLAHQFERLDALDVQYRVPVVHGLEGTHLTLDGKEHIVLRTMMPGTDIRYTTDGTDPGVGSSLYTAPLDLTVDSVLTVTARAFPAHSRASRPRSATFRRATLRAAVAAPGDLRPGLHWTLYGGPFFSVTDLDTAVASRFGLADSLALRGDEGRQNYGLRLTGYLRVPADGLYTFHVASSDGSRLVIDGDTVVDHDGQHGFTERSGDAALAAGLHELELRFFQGGGGGARLRVEVTPPGGAREEVPTGWLEHRPVADGGR
ncbi:MAG: family 20 glycosylhydrolase [Gemmatimonadota bacterium]